MNCPGCGAEILIDEAAFCGECGAKLGGDAPVEADELSAGASLTGAASGDTLRAEQDKVTPQSASPGDGGPLIDTRKVSPPAADPADADGAGSEHAPPAVQASPPAGEPCGDDCPLRLEVNVAKVYVDGRNGVIEMRVANSSSRRMEKVKVLVNHGFVLQMHRTRRTKALPPGGVSRELLVQMQFPEGSEGEQIVGLELWVDDPEGGGVYCGEHSLLVLSPEAPPQQVVMNVQGPSIQASEKGMMGAYADAKTNINAVIQGSEIETAGDLLRKSAQIAAAWKPVPLYFDRPYPAAPEPGGKAVTRRAAHSTRLRLDVQGPFGSRRLIVLSKREVTFGKSRRGADICTLVLPLSRENTKLSRQISGRFDKDTGERTSHMALRLASSGLEVLDHSRNGTFVDGKMVSKGSPEPLGREAKLTLAEVLDLGVRAVAPGQEFDAAHYMPLARGGLFEEALGSRVAAASIERLGNFPDESYLVLYSGAALGSSSDAAVPLAGADLAPRHLLLVHLGDGFYVENISGRSGGASLNWSELEPDSLEPVGPGDTIRAGGVEIRVGEFEQLRPKA
ncbi:MAG: hypothetical protein ACYS9X_01490 [Planctomycetota bacterium]|jgi:hypothetical protein